MSNSKSSPPIPGGASGQPKESGPLAGDGLQEGRRGWRKTTESRTAKKTDPSIFPADQFPATFHRFGDLPLEIRLRIWGLAWPNRLIVPYDTKPALQAHCNRSCQLCKSLHWTTPVRAPTVMQACREARLETQRISKPLPTWLWELSLPLTLSNSWTQAQDMRAMGNAFYRDEMIPMLTQFNVEFDFIHFDLNSINLFSKKPGPSNHDDVFQVALDPEVPLVLDASLLDDWMAPFDAFDALSNGLEALYHRYLKPRKHVHIIVGGLPIMVLTEEGWQKAIQEGLFSGHYMETKLIPIDDEPLIKKYEALRHHCIWHNKKSENSSWERNLWTGRPNHWHDRRLVKRKNMDDAAYDWWISSRLPPSRENLSSAQLYMLQIADFLMWRQGLGPDRGEEIMDLDGHFKADHEFVQKHGLRMPDYTAVVVFQATKAPANDLEAFYKRLSHMRPKFPEEDSSRVRLSIRRRLKTFLGRWGRSF